MKTPSTAPRVAYLMTHYPAVSHTFIQREIAAVESMGTSVIRVALNPPPPGELLSDRDRSESTKTTYLKGQGSVLTAVRLMLAGCRSPIALTRSVWWAVTTAEPGVRSRVWSVFQVLEGVLVAEICRARKVSLIHAHFAQAPASVARAAVHFDRLRASSNRLRWSMTVHGWREFVDETSEQLSAKIADASFVACVSDFTRSQLMRIGTSADWPKLTVVRCGLELERYEFSPHAPLHPRPLIVCVARLSPEKGHGVLLEALAALKADGFIADLKLIGGGPSESWIARRIEELGLSAQVTMLGALEPDSVNAALREADVFCLPTFAEGLPVALMEAMALGIPVVTTAISGIPELVIDGVTGSVVSAGRSDLLAAALRVAATGYSPEIRRSARAIVESNHNIQANVRHLVAEFAAWGSTG